MKNKKHFKALITIECFLVGAPMPPKLARNFVYINAMASFFNLINSMDKLK